MLLKVTESPIVVGCGEDAEEPDIGIKVFIKACTITNSKYIIRSHIGLTLNWKLGGRGARGGGRFADCLCLVTVKIACP